MDAQLKYRRTTGHARHARYCSCGKVVHGNGGKRHFELEGHKRVTSTTWRAAQNQESEHRA